VWALLTGAAAAARGATSSSSSVAATLAGRSSVSEISSPRLRNAVSCIRRDSVSKVQSVVSKIDPSGQNVIVVPVLVVASPRASFVTGAPPP
jgi:hypothetical protein